MKDEQKSKILFKLAKPDGKMFGLDFSEYTPNLYVSYNIHYAWEVLSWAWEQKHRTPKRSKFEDYSIGGHVKWSYVIDDVLDGGKALVEFQRDFLDVIFELATEAGIIEFGES